MLITYRVIIIVMIMLYCISEFSAKQDFSNEDSGTINATKIDFDQSFCKLTQLGTEFRGSITKTSAGTRCQLWFPKTSMHEVAKDIHGEDFPEGSLQLVSNYCRNPTRDPKGPWCYTLDPNVIKDECGVPLCNFGNCRISGLGADYGGKTKISSSGKKCLSWNKRHKLEKSKPVKYSNRNFPDTSRSRAANFCRNPDDDIGGPWCYVEQDNLDFAEKEYCHVPFCDDKDCLVYTRNASVYSTITKLDADLSQVTFWMKLWDPNAEKTGKAKILLSLLPIPTYSEKIAEEWKAGVEIVLSNSGSGMSYPSVEDQEQNEFEETRGILRGTEWTGIWINWAGGFISAGFHGSSKPILLEEYKSKDSIVGLHSDEFHYFGVRGPGILWSTDFCTKSCDIHITFGTEFTRVWRLQRNNDTLDLNFSVRASRDIAIQLYKTPGISFPCFTVILGQKKTVSLVYQQSPQSPRQYYKSVPMSSDFLSFRKWEEFTLSILGSHLRLFSHRVHGLEEILFVNNDLLSTNQWFSIGSEDNIAYWTLFCSPKDDKDISLTNCASDPVASEYEGPQWTSINDFPCVPWTSKYVPKFEIEDESRFVDGSATKALNKCRNLMEDTLGPYCYAISSKKDFVVTKQHCPIQRCRSSECRMAGTANDYIGKLSVTRSGRTCDKWKPDKIDKKKGRNGTKPGEKKKTTKISRETRDEPSKKELHRSRNPIYLNGSLFPENSISNASNYCRDPSRNIAGTWCYTTDPLVPEDLCNVPDCEQPEGCMFFVKGSGIGRKIYILPEHRTEGIKFSLKSWEPDNPDSITLVFIGSEGTKSRYILKIGAVDNEKILLYYQSETEDVKLVKKKTLPHLLYFGKWSKFLVKIPRGKIQVLYDENSNALFEWELPEDRRSFVPVYYYYNSEKGNTIGVAFDCSTSRCHLEKTDTDQITRILPISIRSNYEILIPKQLTINIRGKGVVFIPLLLLPNTTGFHGLSIGEDGEWIYFMKKMYPKAQIYHKQRNPMGAFFTTNSWTNLTIKWEENTINIFCNRSLVFNYKHPKPLLFYYFSVTVPNPENWVIWTANCAPPDIDGPPQDGGWSEWSTWACSVSCNGGVGSRKRYCNSPVPNLRGEPCLGPDVMVGRCNTVACGDITFDTEMLIMRRIRENYTSLIIGEGNFVKISPDPDIIHFVTTDSPKSEIFWSHNGISLQKTSYRMKIDDYNIVIPKVIKKDSGVYTLTLKRVTGSFLILKVVSLAVKPNKDIVFIRETLPATLMCKCVMLGYVYTDLKISLMVDGVVWKDYGITLPATVHVDNIPSINKSHEGMWTYVVEQNDLNFKWITNAVLIKVLGPPNWKTHLMEDKFTKPIFGWMPNETFVLVSAILILIFLLFCVAYFGRIFTKYFLLRKIILQFLQRGAGETKKDNLIKKESPKDNFQKKENTKGMESKDRIKPQHRALIKFQEIKSRFKGKKKENEDEIKLINDNEEK